MGGLGGAGYCWGTALRDCPWAPGSAREMWMREGGTSHVPKKWNVRNVRKSTKKAIIWMRREGEIWLDMKSEDEEDEEDKEEEEDEAVMPERDGEEGDLEVRCGDAVEGRIES